MRPRFRSRTRRGIALATSLMFVVAACGSDDDDAASTTAGGADGAARPRRPPTHPPTPTHRRDDRRAGRHRRTGRDRRAADTDGGATRRRRRLGRVPGDRRLRRRATTATARAASCPTWQCATDSPLAAEGEPIVIGFQNPEGDPNGSFPEFSLAAAGRRRLHQQRARRPRRRHPERHARPADRARGLQDGDLAGRLAALRQRAAHRGAVRRRLDASTSSATSSPIYAAAGVPAIVITPVTDRRLHVAGRVLDRRRRWLPRRPHRHGRVRHHRPRRPTQVAVPWADTPPGVVCYYDLEAKPLDVLNGAVEGTSERAGSIPDLEHIGVPIKPATPDVTPQVTADPRLRPGRDHVLRPRAPTAGTSSTASAASAGRRSRSRSCCPVRASTSTRWRRPATSPRASTSSAAAGVAAQRSRRRSRTPRDKLEAETLPDEGRRVRPARRPDSTRASRRQGFIGMMSLWELASRIVVDGGEVTPESIQTAYADDRRRPPVRLDAAVVLDGSGAVRRRLQRRGHRDPVGRREARPGPRPASPASTSSPARSSSPGPDSTSSMTDAGGLRAARDRSVRCEP